MDRLPSGPERRRRIASASTGISSRHSAAGAFQLDDRQAVVQILPKFPRLDTGSQILVRSADDANVDRVLRGRPDFAHSLLLDRAKQLDLHRERQVGDFVQEQGAGAGGLEKSVAVAFGTRESALLVAKELTLHQVLWDRATVDRHEGPLAPRPLAVNETSGELFSAPGLACKVDWRLLRASFSIFERTCSIPGLEPRSWASPDLAAAAFWGRDSADLTNVRS